MNGDSNEYWARWDGQGPFWQGIFRLIDPSIAQFAENHGMKVSKWRWDAPDRTLGWESNGVKRSLHVYLDPNEDEVSCVVNIDGSAWRDVWIPATAPIDGSFRGIDPLPTVVPRTCTAKDTEGRPWESRYGSG